MQKPEKDPQAPKGIKTPSKIQTFDVHGMDWDGITDFVDGPLFPALRALADDWPEVRAFFMGESDSNQTPYEEQANHLEIGVMAKSQRLGYIMIFLQRFCFAHAEYPQGGCHIFEAFAFEEDPKSEWTLQEIFSVWAAEAKDTTDMFAWDEPIHRKLCGHNGKKTRIRTTFGKVAEKLWNLDTLEAKVRDACGA